MPSLLSRTRELTWRELIYPRPLDQASAIERIHALACDPQAPLVALEVRATNHHVRFLVGTEESAAMNRVVQHLGATAIELSAPRQPVATAKRFAITNRQRPLNTDALDITTHAVLDAVIREVFTANKILLVPLPVAALGSEGSALLGSLAVLQLWDAANERALIPPDQRRPVSIVLDECQQFMRLPTRSRQPHRPPAPPIRCRTIRAVSRSHPGHRRRTRRTRPRRQRRNDRADRVRH